MFSRFSICFSFFIALISLDIFRFCISMFLLSLIECFSIVTMFISKKDTTHPFYLALLKSSLFIGHSLGLCLLFHYYYWPSAPFNSHHCLWPKAPYFSARVVPSAPARYHFRHYFYLQWKWPIFALHQHHYYHLRKHSILHSRWIHPLQKKTICCLRTLDVSCFLIGRCLPCSDWLIHRPSCCGCYGHHRKLSGRGNGNRHLGLKTEPEKLRTTIRTVTNYVTVLRKEGPLKSSCVNYWTKAVGLPGPK